jgi:beta-1,2-mannobiose phosphorylase / 1,2-beta-oligomannan phosphorylase
MIERLASGVMVRPEDIRPSRPDLKVIGTFNPGAVRWHDTTTLLVRVVEAPADVPTGHMAFPRWDFAADKPELVVDTLSMDAVDTADHREVIVRPSGLVRLPFVSHLRLATSRDGTSIDWIDPEPTLSAASPLEEYGVEDARITPLEGEGRCAITYVAPSHHGIVTCLATTSDFKTFERHGPIFTTENKDVIVYPARVGGRYMAMHRPLSHTMLHKPEIWYAESPNLLHWGGHRVLVSERRSPFSRIGGGAPPVRVSEGFLAIYHGVFTSDPNERIGTYCAAALLLDADEPWRVVAASGAPLMVPQLPCERQGYTPNVVFPTGAVIDDDRLVLYSGAADQFVTATVLRLSDIMATLEPIDC